MAVNPENVRSQVKEKFGDDLDDSLASECVNLCQMHNMSGVDLFYKWEAHNFNRKLPFDLKGLREIKALIQREVNIKAGKANVHKKFARGNLSGPQSRSFAASSARSNGRTSIAGPSTPAKPLARPQDGFDLPRLEDKKPPVACPSRVTFVGPSTSEEAYKERTYRYMYEKVSERSGVLDKRIDHFGALVKVYYYPGVEDIDLGDPAAVTEDDVVVVGRITLDSESLAGPVKLNEASLVIESSRTVGSGSRVPLRFHQDVKIRRGKRGVGGQGLFPGAIVALKGKNGGGGSFMVSEILSFPPLETPPIALVKSESAETQFSMCIACGPFTPDADLHFRPLEALTSKLHSTKPAVVLLVGPFIDATHISIKNGDVDASPEDMFRTEFLHRLRKFLDSSPGSMVLLVPSIRDILSDHAVFPQCELSRTLCSDPRIRLLPNPARFTLNGVHIATTSVDVLFHLRREEYFKRAIEVESHATHADPEDQAPTDAMANLCRHILQQRSFYPLFPVPLDLAHEVNLDVSHSNMLYVCPQDEDKEDKIESSDGVADPSKAYCTPDVLIVPSRLKQFSKVVDNTVAINPSFLTKSTYATLTYAGHTSPGPAKDRLSVEISRLDG